ncbi:MAG: hypothetical protein GY868_00290 [Deltaproteobacteria bacterium]|nr:hypothetical protein [Deltaproteobacteria bacterium]
MPADANAWLYAAMVGFSATIENEADLIPARSQAQRQATHYRIRAADMMVIK